MGKTKLTELEKNIIEKAGTTSGWVELSYAPDYFSTLYKVDKEEVKNSVDKLVQNGYLRLWKVDHYSEHGQTVLRKGCDIDNPNPEYQDKIKVYEVNNSECSQWVVFGSLKGALDYIREDLGEIGIDYFNKPWIIDTTLKINWMTPEEFDNIPEFDGC